MFRGGGSCVECLEFVQSVAEEYKIQAMPTFVFLKEGEVVGTVVGARKEELQNTITQLAAAAQTASA